MTSYHSVNIKKKFYKRIEDYVESKTIFGNTKAFILHCIATVMSNTNNQDLGMEALRRLHQDKEVDSTKIRAALSQVAEEKLEK